MSGSAGVAFVGARAVGRTPLRRGACGAGWRGGAPATCRRAVWGSPARAGRPRPHAASPPSPAPEGLHRLRHQRQAADAPHAAEQAELPVPHVAVCGVAAVRVHHHGHDRPQHHRAHDEGDPAPPCPSRPDGPHRHRRPIAPAVPTSPPASPFQRRLQSTSSRKPSLPPQTRPPAGHLPSHEPVRLPTASATSPGAARGRPRSGHAYVPGLRRGLARGKEGPPSMLEERSERGRAWVQEPPQWGKAEPSTLVWRPEAWAPAQLCRSAQPLIAPE